MPLAEIPRCEIFIRGTSDKWSVDCGEHSDKWYMNGSGVHSYKVIPQEKTAAGWRNRYEATLNAAAERSMEHANVYLRLFGIGNLRQFPVLLAGIKISPFYRLDVELGKEYRGYREMYEWALVRGAPRRTFLETTLEPWEVREAPFYTIRVALSEQELDAARDKAQDAFLKCGFDMNAKIQWFVENRKANPKPQSILDDTWAQEADSLIGKLFGHPLPCGLKETGWHAHDGIYYTMGELVKKIMIPKMHMLIMKKAAELGLF